MVAALLLASCGKDNGDDPGPGPNPPDPDPTPTPKTEYLTFATKTANQISVKEVSTGEYEMSMTGTDPYISPIRWSVPIRRTPAFLPFSTVAIRKFHSYNCFSPLHLLPACRKTVR